VSLSTAYALGDVLGLKHSLHRGVKSAKGFYLMYAALIAGAATIVLIPGSPLGLLTEGVQVLAGVLLPSATLFLLLLCNDRAVLGPWVNGRVTNVITGTVIAVLIVLSLILTAAVAFPSISARQILAIIAGSAVLAAVGGAVVLVRGRRSLLVGTVSAGTVSAGTVSAGTVLAGTGLAGPAAGAAREGWRMPALAMLAPAPMSQARKFGMTSMRVYLLIAMAVVVFRVVQVALGH
jgi:hypothetical protein